MMKIIFGLLSSKKSDAAVDQFARAVWPHLVLVHHDFSQQPEFHVCSENVVLVERPTVTKWGDWSLVEATLLLLQQALERFEFDYFQLVSESCLPIRPIGEFAAYLQRWQPAVMINRLLVDGDEALYNYGWRYLTTVAAHRRILRRAGLLCLGNRKIWLMRKGINLRQSEAHREGYAGKIKNVAGKAILRLLLSRPFSAFPLQSIRDCWVGSQWFGASVQAVKAILAARQALPSLARHYVGCPIPDESYFHTLVGAVPMGHISDGNHLTLWASAGFGPDQLDLADLPALRASDLFFARKFSLDPQCPLRLAVMRIALAESTEERQCKNC